MHYSGWNAAAYRVGRDQRLRRNMVRALLLGTGTVTVIYVAVNDAYLYVSPMASMAAVQRRRVGADLIGPRWARSAMVLSAGRDRSARHG